MSSAPSSLEEDLCCPVCCDTFQEPVVLRCSHSFCQACLQNSWRSSGNRDCPICRRRSSTDSPPINLALRNIVESCLLEQRRRDVPVEGGSPRCGLHGEKLLLYCKVDKEAICVVCQTSRKHANHHLCPIEEIALDMKEEGRASLKALKEKLETFKKVKQEYNKTAEHIKRQANETEKQIRKDFEDLRCFLRAEEDARIATLMNETELKNTLLKSRLEHLTKQMDSLSDAIRAMEQKVEAAEVSFFQANTNDKERVQYTPPEPEQVPGVLIDVAKHLSSLKFSVWEKMLGIVKYNPVTMDPNSAAPWLTLSKDLTTVWYVGEQPHIPNNPERCDLCVCVLGAQGFTAGRHCWEVEVGNKPKWDLGVLRQSISRKGVLNVSPKNGFWALALREGGHYSACTTPWTTLALRSQPQRIRILLDYEKGEVSFFNPGNKTHIYTFKGRFTEMMFPYFSPCVSAGGSNKEPLKICPVKISIMPQ